MVSTDPNRFGRRDLLTVAFGLAVTGLLALMFFQLSTLRQEVLRLRREVRELDRRDVIDVAAGPNYWVSNARTLRPVIEEEFDQIELNHVGCPADGAKRLTQLIFWGGLRNVLTTPVAIHPDVPPVQPRWQRVPIVRDFAVLGGRAWTMNRSDRGATLIRLKGAQLHKIRAPLFLETGTYRDPEVDNRRLVAIDAHGSLNEAGRLSAASAPASKPVLPARGSASEHANPLARAL